MGNVWFTSDTHFGHENIIRYCHRPFKTVEEMNVVMIDNWNSLIACDDEVYHLGDLAFFKKDCGLTELLLQLNGNKHLILGNHDKYSRMTFRKAGFIDIVHTPIVYHGFLLSHEPKSIMSHNCKANIHGHIHNNGAEIFIVGGKNIYYNVSVECHDYKPVNFIDILKYYNMPQ